MKAESANRICEIDEVKQPQANLLPPEATAAPPSRSPFRRTPRLAATLAALLVLIGSPAVPAQEPKTPSASIQVTFLPPPLEHATYSLGIFDAKTNHLVRHLQEIASEKDFTIGLNGLITTWDGKDDDGKPVPPGRYAARGYAVGPLKVAGEDIQGNDWAAADEDLRIRHVAAIAILPGGDGLALLAELADGTSVLARFSPDGKLFWRKPVTALSADEKPWLLVSGSTIGVFPSRSLPDGKRVESVGTYEIKDGSVAAHALGYSETRMPLPPGAARMDSQPAASLSPTVADPGLSVRSGVNGTPSNADRVSGALSVDARVGRSFDKDGTVWNAAGLVGLVQTAHDGTVLRKLEVVPGEPLPVAVSAATDADQLYLLEERSGWQRVRGLSWVETKEENGHPVSTWQTFFERSIRAASAVSTAEDSEGKASPALEFNLDENPLSPGRPQKIRLVATFDAKGSYLATGGGLRLRRVSERPNLQSAHLARGKISGTLSFFQSDGAATDEFSIGGVRDMMEFDGGEFELTATGEKPADTRAAEPPDL